MKVTIKEIKKDHYKINLKTETGEINEVFERSEIRQIIETLDNKI